ncbi:discoidin domain-containing protein [Pectobacterium sp. A113-S21-F16]|uniref:discoidin domain-containing protein n=1 Tax=Pectobacterium quasiaquaticum TaxID=2774015 RepID=UPI0018751198|nr:discoidin domain-containing protein [Pectobacterium quasiaquaticum]MBE5220715.1 discoidin domain-containing protein [Pectobacterium quasiaquaticum]
MQSVNIEINVCDSTGKSTCTIHPPIQVDPHSCCHSNNECEPQPSVSGVTSVFGRTGVVTAQLGDYTADQITETATRKFASPDEKAVWNAKQDALVSGTTIRTLFGQSLLGSGDFSPTPAQMGVAAADHTHTTADITDYTQKTKQLIHSSLEAGAGVTLSYNPVNEKTIISAAGGSGSGGSGYIVADRQGATAGQNHAFSISPQNTFNLAAYALKEEAGAANQTYVVDDFNASSEANYAVTSEVIFDEQLKLYTGGIYSASVQGDFYSLSVPSKPRALSISGVSESTVPAMTSDILPIGYRASASSIYNSQYNAYLAFDRRIVSGTGYDAWVGAIGAIPTVEKPQWVRIDMPNALALSGYSLTNRAAGLINSPTTWKLQGSQDDGETWETVHSVVNDVNNSAGAVRNFVIDGISNEYSSYRLLIEASFSSASNGYVAVRELQLFPFNKLMINSGADWYSVSKGVLSSVVAPGSVEDFYNNSFSHSGEISESQLLSLQQINVVSPVATNVKISFTPHAQILIHKSLLSASVGSWAKINAATLTATQTGNGKVRVAVTRDLINWHALRNGAWVDVGTLSADTAGAEALIADGMTPAELGAITAAQWTQLFASNNGVPDSLAFAFALDITDPVTDVATIDRLVLNVNDASSWKVQSPAEVEIRWRTDSVTFRTVTAGNYKLAYQVP